MINSISGSSNGMPRPPGRIDGAKMAEQLFGAIDTKKQGYIEKSDLQTAVDTLGKSGQSNAGPSVDEMFGRLDSNSDGKVTKDEMSSSLQKMAQELDSQYQQIRAQGRSGPRPPPPEQVASDLFRTLDSKNQGYFEKSDLQSAVDQATGQSGQLSGDVDKVFAQWDQDGDGKVTQDELTASLQTQRPPGPPPGGPQGPPPELSKDELSGLAQTIGDSDSQKSDFLKNLISHFDQADGDGNGKLSAREARHFAKGDQNADSSGNEARVFDRMMHLMRAYTETANSNSAKSSSISVAA